jgi:hypothetical protein
MIGITLLVLVLAPLPMLGQTLNASLEGTVTDPTGAAVPGAQISVRAVSTGAIRTAVSESSGLYVFPNLLPGIYDLTVAMKGFQTYTQRGIVLNVNSKAKVDVVCVVGSVTQVVDVTANASPLNFESGEQRGTIATNTLVNLPLITPALAQSAVGFINLLPGVTGGGDENRENFNSRINGGLNEADEALLDGVSVIDGTEGQNGYEILTNAIPIAPDAVQEVTVMTSSFDAQYGGTAGSVTTAVTKSGTDQWHGTLSYLARNDAMNSRPFGESIVPIDKENDFGGTVGGPLKVPYSLWGPRHKTYGFVHYEAFRLRGAVVPPILTVPTAQERNGDFSDWKDSSGNLIPIYDPASPTRLQFMGCNGNTPNVICPSDPRLGSSLAPGWLKYLPAQNLPGIVNNYIPPRPSTGSVNADSTTLDSRIDEYVGNKDRFGGILHYYSTFGFQTLSDFPPQIADEGYRSPNWNFYNRGNWDHTFTPSLVNSLNLGHNVTRSVYQNVDTPYATAVPQIPGVLSNKLPPAINIGGYTGYGSNSAGQTTRDADLLSNRLSWVKGKHTLAFGGEVRFLRDHEANQSNFSGTFNFAPITTGLLSPPPGATSTGNGFASFLLGYVNSANYYDPSLAVQYVRQKYVGLYVSDNWKFTRKLTFNYGLRWDVTSPSRDKYNKVSMVDPNLANSGAGNLLGSLVFAGNYAGSASLGRPYPESIWYRGFAPRLGLAYALSDKTVVRAGYGIFYTLLSYPGWNSAITPGTDGFNATPTISSSNGGLTPAGLLQDGFTGVPRPPVPYLQTTFDNGKAPGLYRIFQPAKPPYMDQWNLAVEHQFTKDFYVTTAYVGNEGTHLYSVMTPINVLNPSLLSMGTSLFDEFAPGDTVKDGVAAPYAGWANQMLQGGVCRPTVAQALQPYPQYCGNLQAGNEEGGSSSYNSFQLKAEERFSHDKWLMVSYTYSKFLSTGSDLQVTTVGGVGQGIISPYQRQRNKSLDSEDSPNTLSIAAAYQLPFGKGKHFLGQSSRVVDGALGGWMVTTIFRAQSGLPLWFRNSACNFPGQFALGCIPALKPGADPFLQPKGSFDPDKGSLLNPASFETTGLVPGPNGSSVYYAGVGPRLSNIRGFGFDNQDVSLVKTIPIKERFKFQLRGDFFNIWNWHKFTQGTTWGQGGSFSTDLGSAAFGDWTGAITAPRNILLGVKLIF